MSECEWLALLLGEKTRVVLSGDLGALHDPLLPAPRLPYAAEMLESTCGDRDRDREHEPRVQCRRRLQAVLGALADGETVLISALSIGRPQDLLYEIEDVILSVGLGAAPAALVRSAIDGR